uniref:Ig-like domain-containing protein n=1 Tax=Jaculus jaculus TaxID=51337 RepID=A0A8C5KJC4_JACJA
AFGKIDIFTIFIFPFQEHGISFQPGFSFLECLDNTEIVVGLSGKPLHLWPTNPPTGSESVLWKKRRSSHPAHYECLSSNSLGEKNSSLALSRANNLAFHIKAATPQDSGFYVVEFTNSFGKVCTINFEVSIFDHVEKPRLDGQGKALEEGKCEVSLSCLVTRDDNVTYTWYRGSKLISTQRNFTYLEGRTDASGLRVYTCNVSNAVSWASHTLSLTQACLSVSLKSRFLPFLVSIIILLILFLGTLACFCTWRKRKRSQTSPKEIMTVYEDVKNIQMRKNQVGHSRSRGGQRELDSCPLKEQTQEQSPPGETSTIYSMIQCQSPSTSQDSANTLYSVVQFSRKSVSKKKNHSPALNCTVYEEVGKRSSKAHNPSRLSRRELESFDIYS